MCCAFSPILRNRYVFTISRCAHMKGVLKQKKITVAFQILHHSYSEKGRKLSEPPGSIKEKIIYNSYFSPKHYLEIVRQHKIVKKTLDKPVSVTPLSLSFISDGSYLDPSKNIESVQPDPVEKPVNLPFQYTIPCSIKENSVEEGIVISDPEELFPEDYKQDYFSKSPEDGEKIHFNWMNDYEKYCQVDPEKEWDDWSLKYGTPDTSIPVSSVACGGCGAFMQCQEPSIPGYLPSEIFLEYNNKDLQTLLCQRCHFVKHYNTALSVQIDPESYMNLLSNIKENSLILLMVDLTDFPCSIWPEIWLKLGHKRPVFIVGNKIDLLWGDSSGWLNHTEKVLRNCFPEHMNILHLCLISAKTGFGVENLVTALHSVWRYRGDVYLIGCTNAGKSTLFNALIQSDYCRSQAVDLVQRATTAPWPGTTLNLLKFPILRPEGWKMFLRNQRLKEQKKKLDAEKELYKLQYSSRKKKPETPFQLIGRIEHTFKGKGNCANFNDCVVPEVKVKPQISLVNSPIKAFNQSRWFCDTPGVIHQDQILDILTTEELLMTIPKDIIKPRTFLIQSGWTVFIAGLARLDFIEGGTPIRCTVFSSKELPVTICTVTDADFVYDSFNGSDYMRVPTGSSWRLKNWPGLQGGGVISLKGLDENESCADIVLSSAGWISITPPKDEICKFIAFTPFKRGIHVRYPPLLPFAVKLRGKKISRSPAYSDTKPYI